MACYTEGSFKQYFDNNMNALGLPVPKSLFDTYQSALATAATLVGTLGILGKGATMAELAGATILAEKLAVAVSFGAAFYVGAVIGSIAVAAGRSLGCGSSMVDVIVLIQQNPALAFKGWHTFYAQNPAIYDAKYQYRAIAAISLKSRAITSPESFEYAS